MPAPHRSASSGRPRRLRGRLRLLLLVLLAALWPGAAVSPAAAHTGGILLTIEGDGGGRVRIAATWEQDGHPVTEGLQSLVSATSTDGRGLDHLTLTPVPGRFGVYAVGTPLPAGTWTVTAESAFPALGHGEAVLTVGTTPTGFPSDRRSVARAGGHRGLVVMIAVLGLAGTAGGLMFVTASRRRRAGRPATAGPR